MSLSKAIEAAAEALCHDDRWVFNWYDVEPKEVARIAVEAAAPVLRQEWGDEYDQMAEYLERAEKAEARLAVETTAREIAVALTEKAEAEVLDRNKQISYIAKKYEAERDLADKLATALRSVRDDYNGVLYDWQSNILVKWMEARIERTTA